MKISIEHSAKVFNEWVRRYSENPKEFSELLDANGKPFSDYGENAAAYFEKLAIELCANE